LQSTLTIDRKHRVFSQTSLASGMDDYLAKQMCHRQLSEVVDPGPGGNGGAMDEA